jgi:hypothetical protein
MSPRDRISSYKVAAKVVEVLQPAARMISDVAGLIVDTHQDQYRVSGHDTFRLGVITIVVGSIVDGDGISPVGSAMMFSGHLPVSMAKMILEENASQIDSAVKLGPDGEPLP